MITNNQAHIGHEQPPDPNDILAIEISICILLVILLTIIIQ